jgi:hypothetical protein
MRRGAILLALTAALELAATGWVSSATDPQSIPSVGPEAKNCPSEEALRAIKGGSNAIHSPYTFVISTKPDVYQTAVRSAPNTNAAPAVFQRIAIYTRYVETGRMFIGWQGGDGQKCGWIGEKDVLNRPAHDTRGFGFSDGPEPLRVNEVLKEEPRNNLWLRAVSANLDTPGVEIDTFTDTSATDIRGRHRLFEIFTVFGAERGAAPASPGSAYLGKQNYYLVGFMTDRGEATEIAGWVRESDVYLWWSRAAAYWVGSGTGEGWVKEEDLYKASLGFMRENPDVKEASDRTEERFPIVEADPDRETVSEKAKGVRESLLQKTGALGDNMDDLSFDKLVKAYKLIMPGNACKKESPKDCLSNDELLKKIAQL